MANPIRISVGIDPGTQKAGFCALLSEPGRQAPPEPMLTCAGQFAGDLPRRLAALRRWLEISFDSLAVLIWDTPSIVSPNVVVAIESGYVGRNARSGLAVAEARGVCREFAATRATRVLPAQPGEARKAIGIGGGIYSNRRKFVNAEVCRLMGHLLPRHVSAGGEFETGERMTEDEANAAVLAYWASQER